MMVIHWLSSLIVDCNILIFNNLFSYPHFFNSVDNWMWINI